MMNRRKMLLGGGAALAASAQGPTPALIKPAALKPGDQVGLITPSTAVTDPERLLMAERTLRYFGLKPKWGKNVAKRAGYLGGSVDERLEDLHAMFADDSIRGVFAVRGGYGSAQLLSEIDYQLIKSKPKVFIGYSDITAMHLAIHKMSRLVTFHGPVAVSAFTEYTQTYYKKALFDAAPIGELTNPPEANGLRPKHLLRAVRPGKAKGPLTGGNLSLVAMTMGTPYEIDTAGKILFLEDIGEEPYAIDRMLTQLRLAGKLQQAAGIVWGECNDCRPRQCGQSFPEGTFTTAEVVDRILGDLKVPVLSGLTIGHTDDQLTLPLGVMAELDASLGTLTITETAAATQ